MLTGRWDELFSWLLRSSFWRLSELALFWSSTGTFWGLLGLVEAAPFCIQIKMVNQKLVYNSLTNSRSCIHSERLKTFTTVPPSIMHMLAYTGISKKIGDRALYKSFRVSIGSEDSCYDNNRYLLNKARCSNILFWMECFFLLRLFYHF